MYDLASGNHTSADMIKALKSNREISYDFELLDKDDIPLGKITATGSIDFNAEATVKRAASLSIREESEIDFLSDRVRPYMCIKVGNDVVRYPLGVFLMSSPSRRYSAGIIGRTIDCYDKTQILNDDKFASRYRVASGTNYISAVSSILQSAGFDDSILTLCNKETQADIEYEIGTSKLAAVNSLLAAINYNEIYANASGTLVAAPYVAPEARAVEFAYQTDKHSIVMSGAEEILDVFDAPNKIVRYLENAERNYLIASVVNDDPTSKLSTISRGRTIVDVAAVNDIADQATLDAYTRRIAAEKKIYQQINFKTAVMPMHECLDCIYITNKDLDVSGKYIETAWSIEMKVGGIMTHTARKAVSL